MENIKTNKLGVGTMFGYGFSELGGTLALMCFTTFGMYYFTTIIGMSPGIAGTISALGSLASAVAAPVAGVFSDGCKSRYGRRRPFLAGVSVPLGIAVWLLFTDFGFSTSAQTIYYALIVIIFYACICFMDVPYTSLGAEMTKDYDERSKLNSFRSFFSMIASILGGALPITIAAQIGMSINDEKMGWSVMAAFFGVITTISVLITWKTTKGKELYRDDNPKVNLKDFLSTFKNKPFRYVIGFYSAGIAAYAIFMLVGTYYMIYYVQMTESQVSIALTIINIAGLGWLPLIPVVMTRYSKQAAWLVFMGIFALSSLATFIFVHPGDVILIYVLNIIAGAGVMVAYTVGWAILPDSIEVDEFKTGKRREGIYYSVISLVQKASQALVIWAGGLILELIGFDGAAAMQSEFTANGIRWMYTIGGVIFLAISFILVIRYPLSREKHKALCEAIEKKKNGEEYDTSKFEDIL